MTIKEQILERVTRMDWVTFAELSNHIEGFGGDRVLSLSSDPNLIIWSGASEQAVTALRDLLASGAIVMRSVNPLCYYIDGGALQLPIAKRPPKGGYREPHWAPVGLRPGGAR